MICFLQTLQIDIVSNSFMRTQSFIFSAQNRSLIRAIMTPSFSALILSYSLCRSSSCGGIRKPSMSSFHARKDATIGKNTLSLPRMSFSTEGFLKQRSRILINTIIHHNYLILASIMPMHFPNASPSLKPSLNPNYA